MSSLSKPGRITLVSFWATWCAACRLDLPTQARLAGSRPDRLDIIAICTDAEDLRKVRAFLGDLAVKGLSCYVDAYGAAAQASTGMLPIIGMPITYLVGPSGRIEGYIAARRTGCHPHAPACCNSIASGRDPLGAA